jgi:circadian clock protein KaiB
MLATYKLTLYVTPDSSGKALAHLYKALEDRAYNDYELEIVDVLQEPDKAVKAKVIGTPALVYHSANGPILMNTVSDVASIRKMLGLLTR